MTTETARAYAESACYQDENLPVAEAGFLAGWRAAREQEPTDAEVEAAARKVFETDAPSHEPHEWFEVSEYARSDYRATARAALTAARAVGRDAR